MSLIFAFPEQEVLAVSLLQKNQFEAGVWEWRHFPDGESYVRVDSAVQGREASILCSLNQPDAKTMPLLFLARTLKDLGAAKVTLIAPYLGYMRQDTRFKPGEAVTADIFAALLSPHIDALITVDPHLHRHHRLEEIYRCECRVISAAPQMAEWIMAHIEKPIIIGPDMESEQWVKTVSESAGAPYVILEKIRHGDRKVEITLPDMKPYQGRTPVLVDDIISTASTMIKTVALLQRQGFPDANCLATHGLFADGAYEALQKAGATSIVTANTIPHASNRLDIRGVLSPDLFHL